MKSFMLYRHLHKIQREQILGLTNDTTYVNSTQTIQEYINGRLENKSKFKYRIFTCWTYKQ